MSISDFLENETWPIINSVTFPDGRMILLKIENIDKNRVVRVICESNVNSFLKFNEEWITGTTILNQYEDSIANDKIFCGEGGQGADGFIYLLNNEVFKWYLFFDNSNPFVHIRKEQDKIIAKNNLNEIWTIDIDKPWKIKINSY